MSFPALLVPILAFFSRDFYRRVAARWRAAAFVYLLAVIVACWLPTLWSMHAGMSKFVATSADHFIEQVPAFTITRGVVASDVTQPYYLHWPDSGKTFFILDTTGEVTGLEGTDAQMLLTRSKFIVKKGDAETRVYDLSGVQSLSIDRDKVRTWLMLGLRWGVPALYVFFVLGAYAGRLIQSVLFGWLGLLLWRPSGVKSGFAAAASVAAVAVTPSIIIRTALDLVKGTFPFLGLILFLLPFVYLHLGLKGERAPDAAAPGGAAPGEPAVGEAAPPLAALGGMPPGPGAAPPPLSGAGGEEAR